MIIIGSIIDPTHFIKIYYCYFNIISNAKYNKRGSTNSFNYIFYRIGSMKKMRNEPYHFNSKKPRKMKKIPHTC